MGQGISYGCEHACVRYGSRRTKDFCRCTEISSELLAADVRGRCLALGCVHAIIDALGARPVEMFASSGGAVTALALVTAHPEDVSSLVAHEPPIDCVLPDAEAVQRARAAYTQVYQDSGWGAGMAAFIAMTSWEGEITDEHLAQPAPDPAAFGMPAEDDGTRGDPLLSERSWAVP